ncbi:MAG: 50S ribosomal protein L29 [Marine Group I thaumarchaeote]|nr:MAG: 50S ribosomal protein L29 [Nitrosopumilales archaeon]GFN40264.1 MAG: 50S ribosomal protein L29 [Marine Group I thaumarchaeote]
MTRIRMKTVRELNEKDLKERLEQMRSELAKFRVDASKGTLRKDSGKVRPLRRDIARILTRLNEKRQ